MSRGDIHWSKDFVEHLRTVHFALVVVAAVLMITVTNSDATWMTAALTQIEQIAKFKKEWPKVPSKLYEQVLLDSHHDTEWHTSLGIVLPADVYHSRKLATWVDVPRDVITTPAAWKFGGAFPTNMLTLTDFKELWNVLNKGVTVILPYAPNASASCEEDLRREMLDGSEYVFFSRPVGRQHLAHKDFECQIGAAEDASYAALSPKFKLKYEIDFSVTSEPRLLIRFNLPLDKSSSAIRNDTKVIESLAIIRLQVITAKIDESYLQRLFFNDWRRGNFERAFPELNSVATGLSTLDIDDAVRRLEPEVASSEKYISLLGFAIPLAQLTRWGALVLLCVQFYLWLHLHELATRIPTDAEGWNVAWIGFYRTRAATVVALVSCFLLPVAAATALAWRMVSSSLNARSVSVLASIIVLASGALGFLTIWRLFKLRHSDAFSASRSVTD